MNLNDGCGLFTVERLAQDVFRLIPSGAVHEAINAHVWSGMQRMESNVGPNGLITTLIPLQWSQSLVETMDCLDADLLGRVLGLQSMQEDLQHQLYHFMVSRYATHRGELGLYGIDAVCVHIANDKRPHIRFFVRVADGNTKGARPVGY